jgi:small subunit ribosomal protein S8e
MRWQGKMGRKPSGGKLILAKGKRKYEIGREQSDTTIAPVRTKKIETLGGNQKMRMLRGNMAIVADPKTGKSKTVKIETVKDNKANLHYMRRNILTKGASCSADWPCWSGWRHQCHTAAAPVNLFHFNVHRLPVRLRSSSLRPERRQDQDLPLRKEDKAMQCRDTGQS